MKNSENRMKSPGYNNHMATKIQKYLKIQNFHILENPQNWQIWQNRKILRDLGYLSP